MTDRIISNITNRSEFKHYVINNNNVIVKVSATWCGPCKRATPIFNDGFLNLPKNVKLILIDADEGAYL